MDDYYSITGRYLSHEDNGTDFIIIRDQFIHELKQAYCMEWLKSDTPISEMTLTAKTYSNIFTDILSKMDGVNVNDLYNGKVSVTVWNQTENIKTSTNYFNEPSFDGQAIANISSYKGKQLITAFIYQQEEEKELFSTVPNVQNILGVHEYLGHFKGKMHDHSKILKMQKRHDFWKRTTKHFKNYENEVVK